MELSNMKNMVVLKNLPSNMVEEAIIIFKETQKVKQKEVIEIDSYRKHKNFDMITFNKITNINEVLKYKGLNVYVSRDSLNLNDEEYLMSDLIDMDVYFKEEYIGKINDIEKNGLNILMVIGNKLIPYNKHFIKSVSLENKKVILENVEGLL